MDSQSPDSNILRLQYEILNRTAADIASDTHLPISIIESTIASEGWKQWWPESSIQEQLAISRTLANIDPDLHISDEEIFVSQADQYLERSRKRLQVYSLAKETYLAQKYMQLEVALIDKAIAAIEELPPAAVQGIKLMSALYKDLQTKGSAALLTAAIDESGLPTVIVRDLSGR